MRQVYLTILAALLWACPPAPVKAPSAPAVTIRVATFNVHRLFDLHCDSGSCGPREYEVLPTEEELKARLAQLAEAIQQINADVVILQEVESQEVLDALNESLRFPVARLGETNAAASLDVAVLARGALKEVSPHRQKRLPLADGGTTTFARELLEVELSIKGADVFILGAHLRSKVKDDPSRRLAEATAINEIIQERVKTSPNALVIFGGDLNDTPGSDTLQAIERGGLVTRVAQELGEAAATIIYKGDAQAIDHLYWAKTAFGVYVRGSAKVYRDESGVWGGSDHAALSADFILSGF